MCFFLNKVIKWLHYHRYLLSSMPMRKDGDSLVYQCESVTVRLLQPHTYRFSGLSLSIEFSSDFSPSSFTHSTFFFISTESPRWIHRLKLCYPAKFCFRWFHPLLLRRRFITKKKVLTLILNLIVVLFSTGGISGAWEYFGDKCELHRSGSYHLFVWFVSQLIPNLRFWFLTASKV